jgi:predicted amidophosphoribosyltransferase
MVKINAVGLYFLKTAENQLSKEIWHLKSDPTIADKLGEGMVYVINTRYQDLKKMDIIVPVPSGDTKRPYNQAALLAIYVSKNIGIPYKDILYIHSVISNCA